MLSCDIRAQYRVQASASTPNVALRVGHVDRPPPSRTTTQATQAFCVASQRVTLPAMGRICLLAALLALALAAPSQAAGPKPGTPEYVQRDNQNIADAYGRQTAPDGQVGNPAYLPALVAE